MTLIRKIWNFYIDGFRSMTIGKTLWMIILIKLCLIFLILKLFFFPNYLGQRCSTQADKAAYVGNELVKPVEKKL